MQLLASKSELALDGGRPVRTQPFPPWPYFSQDEVEAASSVLRSGKVNYWTGEQGRQFEREFADLAHSKHAIVLANGTVALELALYALRIGAGDEVIVPSRTFIASASCVVMRGATPVVADVDPISQTITAETILPVLSPNSRAVIAVHLAGWPCDMDSICALARKRGLKVIEDCAQAHGAMYRKRPVGALGDIGAFSFCQDKIISTGGEGGILTTNDDELWERAWSFKDHGKNYGAMRNGHHASVFQWVHDSFGTNWRLTEMQSAIGRVLVRKLGNQLEIRRRNADILTQKFAKIPALRVTPPSPEISHAYYKYYVFLRPEMLRSGWSRDRVVAAVRAEGVPCYSGICSEIYRETAFSAAMRPPERLQVARELGETSLMFLVHPTLSKGDMLDTFDAVEKVLAVAANDVRDGVGA